MKSAGRSCTGRISLSTIIIWPGNQSICCKSAGDGFHSMVTVCIKDGAGEDSKSQRVPVKSYVNQEIQPEAIAEGF